MDAIREISIEGFRSISTVDRLELRPLNVLIGANGSGKSNFLRAIDLYRVVTTRSEWLPDYVRRAGGADCLLHYGSRHTDRIALSLYFGPEFSSAQSGYAIQLHPLPNDLLSCTVAGHGPPAPILLDHFEPEDVVVADRVNGATEFHRLDAEQLGVWLEDFSLGELWEKNHFGGRASSWSDNPARKQRPIVAASSSRSQ